MRSLSHFILVSTVLLLAATLGPVPVATAQFGGSPAVELEIKIYELEHTPVADASQKLQKLFPDEFDGGDRMTIDERTNTLVVRAPAAVHKAIATLMSNLDRADSKRSPETGSTKALDAGTSDSTSNPIAGASQKPSPDGDGDFELKVFKLQLALASDTARVIKELYADEFKPGTKLTADERTNSLLIRASAPVMMVLEAIILQLDQTESSSPHVLRSTPTGGSGVSDSLKGMAGLMRRNKSLAAKHSPEFQQYEQQAQAAAQAYRTALAAFPKDDARRTKFKAELQGAVHSAFHARQTWQRAQVAEMRKQLDEIENNISARSQHSNEIIERRVEDLLSPERQWDETEEPHLPAIGRGNSPARPAIDASPANSSKTPAEQNRMAADSSGDPVVTAFHTRLRGDLFALQLEERVLLDEYGPNHPKVMSLQKRIEQYQKELRLVDEEQAKRQTANQSTARIMAGPTKSDPVWLTDDAIANAKWTRSNRSILYFFYDAGKPEPEVLHSAEFVRILKDSFVPVKLPAESDDALRVLQQHPQMPREFPLLFVMTKQLEVFGPYQDFSTNEGQDIVGKLREIDEATRPPAAWFAAGVRDYPAAGKLAVDETTVPARSGQSQAAPEHATAGNVGLSRQLPADMSDPRKELLIAENAITSAKAAVDEAAIDADVAEASLAKILEASKRAGTLPESVVREAQNESKRKGAALNRMRADLQGKERVLALAREHLAAQIKFAEIELQQAQSQLEQKSRELERTRELLKRQTVPQQEYDTVAAALERVRLDVVRATARYEFYSKALPAPATSETDPKKPAKTELPAGPEEKRDRQAF